MELRLDRSTERNWFCCTSSLPTLKTRAQIHLNVKVEVRPLGRGTFVQVRQDDLPLLYLLLTPSGHLSVVVPGSVRSLLLSGNTEKVGTNPTAPVVLTSSLFDRDDSVCLRLGLLTLIILLTTNFRDSKPHQTLSRYLLTLSYRRGRPCTVRALVRPTDG